MVAAAVAGSAAASIATGAIGASASESAASKQAAAQTAAAQLQAAQNQQNIANLAPYNAFGQAGLANLGSQYNQSNSLLNGYLSQAQATLPKAMTQAQLLQTPGYQFNLNQGLTALQNQQATAGGALSGNSTKAAINYATGLANSTYTQQLANQNTIYGANTQQFNNALNQQNQLYNQALGPTQLGENAAAQSGYQANTAAANIGSNLVGAGMSQAAGITGAAASINSGISGTGGLGLAYALNQQAQNSGGYGDGVGNYNSIPINSQTAPASDASNPTTYG